MKKGAAANAAGWVGLIGLSSVLLACGQAGPETQGSENVARVSEALRGEMDQMLLEQRAVG